MNYPNLNEEKKLWNKGFKKVACLDEAGRGPLAGPVVASAVMIKNRKFKIENFKKIKDSKKLSAKQREKFYSELCSIYRPSGRYKLLIKHPQIQWGIGMVSEKVIDKINILEATKLAMEKAIKKIKSKPDFLILDGNMRLKINIPQKSIVKADEKVFSCAAASILAKVTRDRIMQKYHKKYSKYGFDKHKGYPTKHHLECCVNTDPVKFTENHSDQFGIAK